MATNDPQYPTATLCGSLPALQVHLSEHKLAAVRAVLNAPVAGYVHTHTHASQYPMATLGGTHTPCT